MKAVLLAALLVVTSAQAQLYRWVDPKTGSLKYSTEPPEDENVKAEVVPYKPPAEPPAPAAASSARQVPSSATASSPKPVPPAQSGNVAALEARWSDLLRALSAFTAQDFSSPNTALIKQLEDFGSVTGELDRLDPTGTPRRRQQAEPMLESLSKGLAQAAAQRK